MRIRKNSRKEIKHIPPGFPYIAGGWAAKEFIV